MMYSALRLVWYLIRLASPEFTPKYRLSLSQDSLDSRILKIGRVAILAQDSFHENAKPCTGAVSVGPVDGSVGAQAL